MSLNRFNRLELSELHERTLITEINRGKNFLKSKDYESAIACFNTALQMPYVDENPCFQKVLTFNIGWTHLEQGNYSEAIYYLEKARLIVDRNIDDAELNVNLLCDLGLSYYKLQDFQNALKYYKMAHAFNLPSFPRSIQLQLHFLREYYDEEWILSKIDEAENTSNDEKALAYYERYIKLKPNDYNSWNNQAYIFNKLQLFNEAKKSAEKAIAIDAAFPNAWRHLGQAYVGLQQYALAEKSYNEAIRLDPKYKEAWSNVGELYLLQNRINNAIKAYSQACNANLKNAENNGIFISFQKQMKELGQKIFKEGLQLSDSGQHAEAIKKYQICLSIAPKSEEVWNDQAYSFNQLGNYHEAIKSSQRAIELKADFANPWCHCGNAYFGLRDYKNALRCFDHALRLRPNYPEAKANKITCQEILNELAALEAVRNCIIPQVSHHKKTSKKKIDRATFAGITLFYNKALSNQKQQLADDLICNVTHLQKASDVYPLLQQCIEDDKQIAKEYDKEPATFTGLLNELTNEVKRFVR